VAIRPDPSLLADVQEAEDAVRRLHPGGATISIITHGAEIRPLVG